MIKNAFRFVLLFVMASCSRKTMLSGNGASKGDSGLFASKPSWQDEFNYTGPPDSTKWSYEIGGGGFGNNELEYYSNSQSNAKAENGKLLITARKEDRGGRHYTSARLLSKLKGDFLYGRVGARAKLPVGRGTWPAIWMLPTDNRYGGWPSSGEIDIMENVGYEPNKVLFTVHTAAYNHVKGTQRGGEKMMTTANSDFHLYRVDWLPDSIRGYYDNELVYAFANEHNGSATRPFDQRFYLLLNLAIGGNWGGKMGVDDSIFPTAMEVDYVRYYKMK